MTRPYDQEIEDRLQAARAGEPIPNGVRFRCGACNDPEQTATWQRISGVWRCDTCGEGGDSDGLAKKLGIAVPTVQERAAKATSAPSPLLIAALAYAAKGWHVFPLHSLQSDGKCDCRKPHTDPKDRAKHPRTTNGLLGATTDPAVIEKWWRMWPTANIGISTGPSGLVVIDIDPRSGGDESWRDLTGQHGELEALTVVTGSGGAHYYCAADPDRPLKNSASLIGPGIDTRAVGGYVIAPPSLHASGRHYTWEDEDVAIPPVPPWVLARLVPKDGKPLAEAVGEHILDGTRDATLASLAGTMRRRNFSPAAIYAALQEENGLKCDPPLSDARVRKIANSVSSYPASDPVQGDNEPLHIEAFKCTDSGNGELFAHLYNDRLRYDWAKARWLLWDRHRWMPDPNGELLRLAKEAARTRYLAAADVADTDTRATHAKWSFRSESSGSIEAMLKLARAEHPIADDGKNWDSNPMLLGCENGIVNLATGEFRAGRIEDRVTRTTGVVYDKNATCPQWLHFLETIHPNDPEMSAFLKRAIGYTLTGSVKEQVWFMPFGAGANGKGTAMNMLSAILGDYAGDTPAETVCGKNTMSDGNGPSPNIAALDGKRYITCTETDTFSRFNSGRIKNLTGGNLVTARALHHDPMSFLPQFKLWLATNSKPGVMDDSDGFWRRVRLIPFNEKFEGANRDNDLEEKLRTEKPGILNWAIEGALEWQRMGLNPPAKVLMATLEYRQSSDPIADFISDCCVVGPECRLPVGQAREQYRQWATKQGMTEKETLSGEVFCAKLGQKHPRGKSGALRYFSGIGIRAWTETVQNDDPQIQVDRFENRFRFEDKAEQLRVDEPEIASQTAQTVQPFFGEDLAPETDENDPEDLPDWAKE